MAARATMADIITRLRGMVGDADSATFTDDELQAILDQRRTDAIHAALGYRPSVSTSGTIEYHDYYAVDAGAMLPWESDPTLQDSSGAELTPDTSEPMRGYWRFTTTKLPPVYITGAFYDMNGAAAVVCQELAGRVAQEFDYGTDGHDFSRSQKHQNLLAQSREFARRALPPGRAPSSLVGA